MKKILKLSLFAVLSGVIIFVGIKLVGSALNRIEKISRENEMVVESDDTVYASDSSDPIEQRVNNPNNDAKPISAVSYEDVSAIVDAVMPAVVSIDCTVPVEEYNIFGGMTTYIQKTSGSGFIVSQSNKQLFICTNEHVIKGASTVSISFCNDYVADAMVVGYDTSYDLAIVSVDISKIDKNTLSVIKVASIGNSDDIKIGDINIAIGNSLGHGQAVTVGYISAKDRTINVDGIQSRPLLQTDAAINPGNSGGPLLDIYGRVIGINCAKYSGVLIEGIGYAIPINNVVATINELINSFSIAEGEEGRIAILGKDVSEGYSKGFSMPMGVYVFGIEEGSRASESGLMVGDIITMVNGQEILSFDYLSERVGHYKAGTSVTLTVMRHQKNKYVEVEINVVLDTLE
ncbi:MAG: trypsin-like peptidase domain-containing protein [Lachnospiraceae bacterium]|nr:trypsin-like peptidase domain-containing protein [Lachnospiraceae bacterium]